MRRLALITIALVFGPTGPAAADACCILKADKGNVCVNAPGPTCRAHPRYVSYNQKKLCKSAGTTADFTCRNKTKNELSAKLAFEQRHITLRHMGHEYEKPLMNALELSLENERGGLVLSPHGFGIKLKFGE